MTFDPTSVEVTCVTVPKDHCVQVPWEYVNVCGYSYQFCKNYHIHTYTYYVHTTYILHTTYYVQNQWSHSLFLNYVHSLFLNYVQARQKGIALNQWNWNAMEYIFLSAVLRYIDLYVCNNSACHLYKTWEVSEQNANTLLRVIIQINKIKNIFLQVYICRWRWHCRTATYCYRKCSRPTITWMRHMIYILMHIIVLCFITI